MDKLEVLKRSDLFGGLDREQLELVEKISASQVFEPGEIICRQGSKQDKIYIIEEGLVGLFLELGPLTRRQIQAASNFEAFGWSALLPTRRCGVSVVAIEKTKVVSFEGQELLNLCLSNLEIGFEIKKGLLHVVLDRLDHAYAQLMGVTCQI